MNSITRRHARLRFNWLRREKKKGQPYTEEELHLLSVFDYYRWRLAKSRRVSVEDRPPRDFSLPGLPPVPRSAEWRRRMGEHRKKLDAVWTAPSLDSSEHGRICRAMAEMLVEEPDTRRERQTEHHARGSGDGHEAGGQL